MFKNEYENVRYYREYSNGNLTDKVYNMNLRTFKNVLWWARLAKKCNLLINYKLYVNDICIVESK